MVRPNNYNKIQKYKSTQIFIHNKKMIIKQTFTFVPSFPYFEYFSLLNSQSSGQFSTMEPSAYWMPSRYDTILKLCNSFLKPYFDLEPYYHFLAFWNLPLSVYWGKVDEGSFCFIWGIILGDSLQICRTWLSGSAEGNNLI